MFGLSEFKQLYVAVFQTIVNLNAAIAEERERITVSGIQTREQQKKQHEEWARWHRTMTQLSDETAKITQDRNRKKSVLEPTSSDISELEMKFRELQRTLSTPRDYYMHKQRIDAYLNWLEQKLRESSLETEVVSEQLKKLHEQYRSFLQNSKSSFVSMMNFIAQAKQKSGDAFAFHRFNLPVIDKFASLIDRNLLSYDRKTGQAFFELPVCVSDLMYFSCRSARVSNMVMHCMLEMLYNETERELESVSLGHAELTHWRMVVIDTRTLYDTSIGYLLPVSGSVASSYASPACHNRQEADEILDELWVIAHKEYPDVNARTLVVRGSGFTQQKLSRLVNNQQSLNMQIIIINERKDDTQLSEAADNDATIFEEKQIGTIGLGIEGAVQLNFVTSDTVNALSAKKIDIIRRYTELKKKPALYFNYADQGILYLSNLSAREVNRDLNLLYGINAEGERSFYFTHDNQKEKGSGGNIGYIVGASGSGKSTFLHTIITDLLRHYHPDDVELWLADFKMKEFAQYINPMPPHVRYILLDESPDMVRSLIDELTTEMKSRQRKLAATGKKWYQDIKNLPLIFVIIDEFTVMSQAIKGDADYRLKLQNIFTQSRDQGIRLLISSQTFSGGVSALNDVAKQQIGIRIAMSTNDKTEMKEVIAMPRRLTDEEDGQIKLLPKHHVVTREQLESGNAWLKESEVLYLDGDGQAKVQRQIKQMQQMIPVADERQLRRMMEQDPKRKALYYINKHPLVVTGDPSRLPCFDELKQQMTSELCEDHASHTNADDRLLLWTGRPRRLEHTAAVTLQARDDENLLVICDYERENSQRDGIRSLLSSMTRSCAIALNDGLGAQAVPEIWAPSNCDLLQDLMVQGRVLCEPEQIRESAIEMIEKVSHAQMQNRLVIVIEPDRIVGSAKKKAEKAMLLEQMNGSDQMASSGFSITMPFASFSMDKAPKLTTEPVFGIHETKHDASASPFESAAGEAHRTAPRKNLPAFEQILKYLIAAGSEFGVHIVLVTTSFNAIRRTSYLPSNDFSNALHYFRHRIAFRLSEDDDATYDMQLRQATRMLTDNLSDCFVYRDGRRVMIKEPYRLDQ